MRLQNCNFDIDYVLRSPLKITSPEQSWIDAHDSGAIPNALFVLYGHADYFSFGSAPGFLADPENVLFSYFAMLSRSIKDLLLEAHELVNEFARIQERKYDPVKRLRGQAWDPEADTHSRRTFKYLMVSLSGTLDSLADLVALFFTSRIPGLRLGKAQFPRITDWLQKPFASPQLIYAPHEHHLQTLHDELCPLVLADAPEQDWFPLMQLFRNKAAHMGSHMFQTMSMQDQQGLFYTFFPRQWPYIGEKYHKPADPNHPADPAELRIHLEQAFMHEDVISFTENLRQKVFTVVAAGVEVITTAYQDFGNFPVNEKAVAELEKSSEAFEFQYFQD